MGEVVDGTKRFAARRAAADKKRGKVSGDQVLTAEELRTMRLKAALESLRKPK